MAAARACIVGLGLLLRVSYADAFTCEGQADGPWNGVAATIPGTIQAEEYDCGGKVVSYHDTTGGNQWKVFRKTEAVDVIGRNGGYMVGQTAPSEYMRYTVDLPSKVEAFDFTFRVSTNLDRIDAFHIVAGGTGCEDYTTDLTGLVTIRSTGSFENVKDRFMSGPRSGGLPAGSSQIWLCLKCNGLDIDSFTMSETTVIPRDGGGPYNGVAATIPGTIQAEEFDEGGEGVGYYDTTQGNNLDVFRADESVDVDVRNGGLVVGHATPGEYLRYTVELSSKVEAFDFTFRVSTDLDRIDRFHIVAGGTGCGDYTTDLTGLVTLRSTGSFYVYRDQFISGPCSDGLPAGTSQIWLCVKSGMFSIDSFTMSETAVQPPGGGRPFNGVGATVPGTIEAEEFDYGGKGAAYYDTTNGNQWNVFRTDESVDVATMNGGFVVGSTASGEYLRYTVELSSKVEAFDFTFQVSAIDDRIKAFRIVSGGTGCGDYTTDLSGPVTVPNTGAFKTYKERFISGPCTGGLPAGSSQIWLCVKSGGFNIDSFTMSEASFKPLYGGPYRGIAATIPGTIEAEEYDSGGQGTAYFDTTDGNQWNVFRTDEDVDVHTTKGGYTVGAIAANEYLRYTVDLKTKVEAFDFTFRVAATQNRIEAFHVVSGGTGCGDYTTDLSGLVTVPNTGSYQTYQDRFISGPSTGGLPAGLSKIWLCVKFHDFDLDYFTMSETPPLPAAGNPYNDVAATIPGTIQAEEYDEGGEGVGYSDSTEGNFGDVFRPDDDVDIRPLDDGYSIGYVTAGEYLRYTVDVAADVDAFLFDFTVASANGLGSFRIVSGGSDCDDYTTDLSGRVTVPSTGGNNRYKTFSVSGRGNGGLLAGKTQIWLCILSQAFFIDSFTLKETSTS